MEGRLIRKLLHESMKFNDGSGYRNGFLISLATVFYYHLNCLFKKSKDVFDFNGPYKGVVCFWQFRNEGDAIQLELNNGRKDWIAVHLEPHICAGVNWRQVFWSNPFLLFRFFAIAVTHVGTHSLRSFAHGYIGYLLFRHLLRINRGRVPPVTVLTANMVSPISVAVNEFARAANLETYYLEHAITPKASLHGIEYSRLFVRSKHTKTMLVQHGYDAAQIEVSENYSYIFPPRTRKWASSKRIGIAVNDADSIESIEDLVFFLAKKNLEIIIRVHDADKRFSRFESIALKCSAAIESATSRPIRAFLRNVDFVFAGNSTVLFDAIVASVPVAYYWTGKEQMYDYYGIAEGIGCPSVRNISEIDGAFDFYHNSAISC